jgi:hypothetical protein
MFEEELKILLEKSWTDEERGLIVRLTDNVLYYKKLIPKSLKQDILDALKMCNSLKIELDVYRNKCECKCENKCECKCENKCECKCENKCECKCENKSECECKCE